MLRKVYSVPYYIHSQGSYSTLTLPNLPPLQVSNPSVNRLSCPILSRTILLTIPVPCPPSTTGPRDSLRAGRLQSSSSAHIIESMALDSFFQNKIEDAKLEIVAGQAVLRRLEAQRNDYNSRVRLLREELGLLQQPGSYVGEVVKVMGTKKVLVKVHPEGKYGKLDYFFMCATPR